MRVLKRFVGEEKGGEGGFTLVELLVVISIIVALGAVTVISVAKFAGKGQQGGQTAELSTVQAAMDAMMADKLAPDVAVQAHVATVNDGIRAFGALPTVGASLKAVSVLDPVYLRAPTTCSYYWNTAGRVSQVNDVVGDACYPS